MSSLFGDNNSFAYDHYLSEYPEYVSKLTLRSALADNRDTSRSTTSVLNELGLQRVNYAWMGNGNSNASGNKDELTAVIPALATIGLERNRSGNHLLRYPLPMDLDSLRGLDEHESDIEGPVSTPGPETADKQIRSKRNSSNDRSKSQPSINYQMDTRTSPSYSKTKTKPNYLTTLQSASSAIITPTPSPKIHKFRLSEDGVPLYAQPLERLKTTKELEQKEEERLQKLDERLKNVGLVRDFKLIDKHGNALGYSYNGTKARVGDIKPPPMWSPPPKDIKIKNPNAVFRGDILEKTADYVEKFVNEKKKPKQVPKAKEPWIPGKLPASTYSMQPDSAVLPSIAVRNWPEYAGLRDGDVMITVEFCSQCWQHDEMCRHNEDRYRQVAASVGKAAKDICSTFSLQSCTLLMKPVIPTEDDIRAVMMEMAAAKEAVGLDSQSQLFASISNSVVGTAGTGTTRGQPSTLWGGSSAYVASSDGAGSGGRDRGGNSMFQEEEILGVKTAIRLGALEVQIAVKSEGRLTTHILHSKLFRGCWPKTPAITSMCFRLLDDMGFMTTADLADNSSGVPGRSRGKPGKNQKNYIKKAPKGGDRTFSNMYASSAANQSISEGSSGFAADYATRSPAMQQINAVASVAASSRHPMQAAILQQAVNTNTGLMGRDSTQRLCAPSPLPSPSPSRPQSASLKTAAQSQSQPRSASLLLAAASGNTVGGSKLAQGSLTSVSSFATDAAYSAVVEGSSRAPVPAATPKPIPVVTSTRTSSDNNKFSVISNQNSSTRTVELTTTIASVSTGLKPATTIDSVTAAASTASMKSAPPPSGGSSNVHGGSVGNSKGKAMAKTRQTALSGFEDIDDLLFDQGNAVLKPEVGLSEANNGSPNDEANNLDIENSEEDSFVARLGSFQQLR